MINKDRGALLFQRKKKQWGARGMEGVVTHSGLKWWWGAKAQRSLRKILPARIQTARAQAHGAKGWALAHCFRKKNHRSGNFDPLNAQSTAARNSSIRLLFLPLVGRGGNGTAIVGRPGPSVCVSCVMGSNGRGCVHASADQRRP